MCDTVPTKELQAKATESRNEVTYPEFTAGSKDVENRHQAFRTLFNSGFSKVAELIVGFYSIDVFYRDDGKRAIYLPATQDKVLNQTFPHILEGFDSQAELAIWFELSLGIYYQDSMAKVRELTEEMVNEIKDSVL